VSNVQDIGTYSYVGQRSGIEEKPHVFGRSHTFLSRRGHGQNKISYIYNLIYTKKCVEYLRLPQR
jgi:hypothetical protein